MDIWGWLASDAGRWALGALVVGWLVLFVLVLVGRAIILYRKGFWKW